MLKAESKTDTRRAVGARFWSFVVFLCSVKSLWGEVVLFVGFIVLFVVSALCGGGEVC